MSLKVLLADDHKIMRSSLRVLLDKEPSIEVVGEAENGRQTVQMAEKLSPDVVIMDICMPDLNGIEAAHQITTRTPKIKVLALSMYSDRRFVLSMLKAGALGYLMKDCAFEELIQAIQNVSKNRVYLSRGLTDYIIKDYISRLQKDELSAFSILTAREREVLQLIAEGKTAKEIAFQLNISVKTVETHRHEVMNRLNIHTVAGLTRYAISEGLTSL
jgi:two-component system response regulator NreC